jgi:hypothetical protein
MVEAADRIDLTGTNATLEFAPTLVNTGSSYVYVMLPVTAPIGGFAVGDGITFADIWTVPLVGAHEKSPNGHTLGLRSQP